MRLTPAGHQLIISWSRGLIIITIIIIIIISIIIIIIVIIILPTYYFADWVVFLILLPTKQIMPCLKKC